jgi:aspartyl-tRNA(Asn)/glutamyl-tRNA(Gln) amidotransferase subunit A
MIDTKNLTIKKAHSHLINGDFTAVDLVKAYLANIEKSNKEINAYLEVFDDVIAQAEEADRKIQKAKKDGIAQDLSVLIGIPFAIKDNILIKGRKATSASKILEGYHAPYDATSIVLLKRAGAIFLGRTNMDEFAMGGSTENSAFGVTKNPHDTTRVSGGSSGGSAAAVAMDGALTALGSDTGGSVRQPGSFCGVVGMKPTYGAISRYGLMSMGSSLDQIGPITKNVEDAEIIFNALKGQDPFDSTSCSTSFFEEVYSQYAKKGQEEKSQKINEKDNEGGQEKKKEKKLAQNMIIGVPTHFTESEGIDPEVTKNFKQSIEKFKKLGYEIKEISLPNIGYSLAVYYIIMPAEASTNLARFDGVKFGLHKEGSNLLGDYLKTRGEGFGKEVRRRILLGAYVLSSGYYDAYYNKANQVRKIIKKDFEKAFEEVDAIITPTAPTPAFKIGEKANDPLQMYLADVFTVTANIVGIPAISIPSGFTGKLPLGIQLMAREGAEDVLFELGKRFENFV